MVEQAMNLAFEPEKPFISIIDMYNVEGVFPE